jgi:hypothetical protein
MAYPVADALRESRVTLVFGTGCNNEFIPYKGVKRCEKPVQARGVAEALSG